MKRSKRHSIRRIALGLAVAAVVPATAQARPLDISGGDVRAIHAAAVPSLSVHPDSRAISRSAPTTSSTVEIPYLSHGVGVSAKDLGLAVGPDDRSFSRASEVGAPVARDGGFEIDAGTGSLGGLVLILAAGGAALAIHQSKKAKLSPA